MVKVITLACVTSLVLIVEAAFDSIASDMSVERSMCGEPVHEFHPSQGTVSLSSLYEGVTFS